MKLGRGWVAWIVLVASASAWSAGCGDSGGGTDTGRDDGVGEVDGGADGDGDGDADADAREDGGGEAPDRNTMELTPYGLYVIVSEVSWIV